MATAPNDPGGYVKVSPKGAMDTFQILGPHQVGYLDLTGSGIETVAHQRENGRIVLMFCAFEGPPKVIRLHGKGRIVERQDEEFPALKSAFNVTAELEMTLRSIIVVEVSRVADSCGFVVPKMQFIEERDQLFRWAEGEQRREGDEWALKYQQANNLTSIDGLAGLDWPADLAEDEARKFSSKGRAL